MSKVRVNFSVSIDGFAAGLQQSIEHPMGVGGMALAEWAFATRTFQRMHDQNWTFDRTHDKEGGTTGIDDACFARGFLNVGAYILGRNMFGPIRGPWPDNSWQGWWGDTPPFRNPVFVLTHYPANRSRCREARRSISRRRASTAPSSEPQRPRTDATFVSEASPPYSSIFAPASSTS